MSTPIITIGANPKLTKLNTTVNYNPELNYPAVSVFSKGKDKNGHDVFEAFGICYITTNGLVEKTLVKFNKGSYSGFTPTQSVVLTPGLEIGKARVVLSDFGDIQNADLVNAPGTSFTARSFAVCYDLINPTTSYECDVYALHFEYTVNSGPGYEVLFLAQGDLDPRLSRGTVSTPAVPQQ